jgi:hypothetical protein
VCEGASCPALAGKAMTHRYPDRLAIALGLQLTTVALRGSLDHCGNLAEKRESATGRACVKTHQIYTFLPFFNPSFPGGSVPKHAGDPGTQPPGPGRIPLRTQRKALCGWVPGSAVAEPVLGPAKPDPGAPSARE